MKTMKPMTYWGLVDDMGAMAMLVSGGPMLWKTRLLARSSIAYLRGKWRPVKVIIAEVPK